MKRYFLAVIFLSLTHFAPLGQASEEIPPRSSYINDFAGLLSEPVKHELELTLEDFEYKTTNQILVATFSTLGDENMEHYASRLADAWKIGYKDLANGVILMVFQKEHRAWIEVGAGLTDQVPLNFCRKLIQDQIGPDFRNYHYDRGTRSAIRKIIRKIDPSYEFPYSEKERTYSALGAVAALLIILFLGTLAIDAFSYSLYRSEIREPHPTRYWHQVGTYSFLEWWLLYGLLTHDLEYVHFYLFFRWLNSSFLITSEGLKSAFIKLSTGRGRFWGNGNFGNWLTIDRKEHPKYFFTLDEIDQLAQAISQVETHSTAKIVVHLEWRCPITDPLSRAIKLFHTLHLHKHPARNATLIYFATHYRLFAILGDQELNRLVPEHFWHDLRVAMENFYSEGKFLEGTLHAIHEIAKHLSLHPPQSVGYHGARSRRPDDPFSR